MTASISALDASLLHLEDRGSQMHMAALMLFDGHTPALGELSGAIEARLDRAPRCRQRLAEVPFGQGRPRWVDDVHFNIGYHVRHTALPHPGGEHELQTLVARLLSQRLDRNRPLWEIWLIEGLEDGGFALLTKSHHALVDGGEAVDIGSLLLDTGVEPAGKDAAPPRWEPGPPPGTAQLLAEALRDRATLPSEIGRGVRKLTRRPRRTLAAAGEAATTLGALALGGLQPAPRTPLNVPIGPHRRYTWIDADLRRLKAIRSELGGTVNDVVLTAVTLGLGSWMRARGRRTDHLVLRALVPVSLSTGADDDLTGSEVTTMWVPLPVGVTDPTDCFVAVREAAGHIKQDERALSARRITQLADFAPPTILSQAARLQSRQRLVNLVVTNVPGPQQQLFLLGRPLRRVFQVVPLAENLALAVAVVSYNGHVGFGLTADYDALPDLAEIGEAIAAGLDDLTAASGLRTANRRFSRTSTPPSLTASP